MNIYMYYELKLIKILKINKYNHIHDSHGHFATNTGPKEDPNYYSFDPVEHINEISKESKPWINSLSEHEKKVVQDYTGTGSVVATLSVDIHSLLC